MFTVTFEKVSFFPSADKETYNNKAVSRGDTPKVTELVSQDARLAPSLPEAKFRSLTPRCEPGHKNLLVHFHPNTGTTATDLDLGYGVHSLEESAGQNPET